MNEIEKIKQQQSIDKKLFEEEKEKLLSQIVEIEQELNILKSQPYINSSVPNSISYDV